MKTMMPTAHEPLIEELHAALTAEAEAWACAETAKLDLFRIEAGADLETRRAATEAGEKVTEAVIAHRVSLQADVNRFREAVTTAEYTYRQRRADVAACELRISLTKAALYSTSGRLL